MDRDGDFSFTAGDLLAVILLSTRNICELSSSLLPDANSVLDTFRSLLPLPFICSLRRCGACGHDGSCKRHTWRATVCIHSAYPRLPQCNSKARLENMETIGRAALANLAKVKFGSVREAALTAGIDPRALARWFEGKNTVSEAKRTKLYVALGLMPDEPPTPNPAGVHIWQPKKAVAESELGLALEVVFPKAPEAVEAPWSREGLERAKKFLRVDFRPELYGFYDGGSTMVVFRPVAGHWIDLDRLNCRRRGGTEDKETSTLSKMALDLLLKKRPTPQEFLLAWFGSPEAVPRQVAMEENGSKKRSERTSEKTLTDLDVEVRARGLSYEEAIRRLRNE